MAQAVIMPKFGQTVEEATIVKWHKKEGDQVNKGDVLFEIETDKAVLEAESFFAGTILKIFVGDGETVPVSSTVAYIGEKGEKVPERPKPVKQAPAVSKQEPAASSAPAKTAVSAPSQAATSPAPTRSAVPAPPQPVAPSRLLISPRAKALAKSKVIDPSRIAGTGPNGRIVEKDVTAYLDASGYGSIRISPSAKRLAAKEDVDILSCRGTGKSGRIMVGDVKTRIAEKPKKMTKIRKIISQRLTESFTTTPHFYVTVSVDMTDLLKFRKEIKAQGKAYSVTAFILEAVVLSLQELPLLNSFTDGEAVSWRSAVDLGMAVGLEDGLVVPVLRDAQDLSVSEIHDLSKELAGKARDGKLTPDEMVGSSFTVSNMGMLDVESFEAIINPGESGILAIGSTIQKVIVIDGKMKIRSMMKITLSTDHRIVDGAMGASFVNAVKNKLEDMELWKNLT